MSNPDAIEEPRRCVSAGALRGQAGLRSRVTFTRGANRRPLLSLLAQKPDMAAADRAGGAVMTSRAMTTRPALTTLGHVALLAPPDTPVAAAGGAGPAGGVTTAAGRGATTAAAGAEAPRGLVPMIIHNETETIRYLGGLGARAQKSGLPLQSFSQHGLCLRSVHPITSKGSDRPWTPISVYEGGDIM